MRKTVLEGNGGQVWSVSLCRETKTVAAACEDRTIKRWDATTGQAMETLEGHGDAVKAVAFAPRSRFLASGAKDQLVKMWSPCGRVEFVLEGHRAAIQALAFSEDSRFLVSGGGDANKPGEIFVWDLAKARSIARLEGHGAEVLSVAIAPDRETLASSDAAGVVILWDLVRMEIREKWAAHEGPVWATAIHPEGKVMVTGGQDGRVKFWKMKNGRELANRQGDSSPVRAVAFSCHGRQLAIGCLDGDVKLWRVACRESSWFKLCRMNKPVYSLTYAPERMLLAAGPDHNVTFWQTAPKEKTPEPFQRIDSGTDVFGRNCVPHKPVDPAAKKLEEFMSTLSVPERETVSDLS
jgi:WD40 repeat protein